MLLGYRIDQQPRLITSLGTDSPHTLITGHATAFAKIAVRNEVSGDSGSVAVFSGRGDWLNAKFF